VLAHRAAGWWSLKERRELWGQPVNTKTHANYTLQQTGGGRLGADFVRTLATRR